MEQISKTLKGQRVYRAENINAQENIVQTMSLKDKNHDKCVVCLCISNRSVTKKFSNRWGAMNQLKENRDKYKDTI